MTVVQFVPRQPVKPEAHGGTVVQFPPNVQSLIGMAERACKRGRSEHADRLLLAAWVAYEASVAGTGCRDTAPPEPDSDDQAPPFPGM
jgi:hypothetical protein